MNFCKTASLLLASLIITLTFSGCVQTTKNAPDDNAMQGDGSSVTEKNSSGTLFPNEDEMFPSEDEMFPNEDEMFPSEDEMFPSLAMPEDATQITLASDGVVCDSDKVNVNGSRVTITSGGTYLVSGRISDGGITVDAGKGDKVCLILCGAEVTSNDSAALYIKQADEVTLMLSDGTENKFVSAGEFVGTDENNIDAAIFSKETLIIYGDGTLYVNSAYGHGIVSKDDLIFLFGNINVNAARHALSGKDSVRVAEGTFELTSAKDGIHSENADDSSLGFVYIEDGRFAIKAEGDGIDCSSNVEIKGGELYIAAGDDGIHADNALLICDGTIVISESYEGLEGTSVEISGGDITIKSSDDGINATDGKDLRGFGGMVRPDSFGGNENCYIKISGGVIHIDSDGDGVDSNGNLYVSGGETYIDGPTSSDDSAIDYENNAEITGGVFVAAGAVGMAQNFGSASTQGSIMANASGAQTVTLSDSDGNTLVSYTPTKNCGCIVISCPELVLGEKYTLKVGSSETEITLTSLIYGGGGGPGGHGGFGGPDGFGDHGGKGKNGDFGNHGGMKPPSGFGGFGKP